MTLKTRRGTKSKKPDDAASAKGLRAPLTDKLDSQKLGDFKKIVKEDKKSATKIMIEDSGHINYAIELLRDEDVKVKANVVECLGNIAKNGTDISIAIPALADVLNDVDSRVRHNATWALWMAAEKGANILVAIPALIERLKDLDGDVMLNPSVQALKNAALNEKTKEEALAALFGALDIDDTNVKECVIWILGTVAKKGTDISIVIPALNSALKDENCSVVDNAAWALGNAAKNGADISIVIPALADRLSNVRSDNVKRNIINALKNAAEKGADILIALPALRGALNVEYETDTSDECAVQALGAAALNKKTRDPAIAILVDALNDDGSAVRRDIVSTLSNVANNGTDISIAVPKLIEILLTGNTILRCDAASALAYSMKKNNYRTVELIVTALTEFTQSAKFVAEVNGNTPFYIEMIGYVGMIMDAAKKAEDAEGAKP